MRLGRCGEMIEFFNNKKVLITGHTGFKGSWLCRILSLAGANVVGYSLEAPTTPNLFDLIHSNHLISIYGDVRDLKKMKEVFANFQPEIVIHLAAQPLVRESYINPVYTYDTNVMGTVNICECVRTTNSVKSFLNVTTDKVYQNNEWEWGYREIDRLNGYDPYSNSKSCSELVTDSYKKSFFNDMRVAVSTARAGNVIGGGDFANDRIIPDCVRAASKKEVIIVRNPNSTRPYQHVLEPLSAYLLIVQKQFDNKVFEDNYNVGPDETDCISTGELADLFCQAWKEDISWKTLSAKGPHEANFLKLDCSKIKNKLGWQPKWNVKQAIQKTVDWSKIYLNAPDKIIEVTNQQIEEFFDI